MIGARRVQNDILKKYPKAKIRIYAIWSAIIPTDARAAWNLTGRLLPDARVEHFWDDSRVAGEWFAKLESPDDKNPGVMWDAFLVFGPDAQWSDQPKPRLSLGNTIRDEFEELEKHLETYLKN